MQRNAAGAVKGTQALSVSIPLFKPSEQGIEHLFLGSKMEDGQSASHGERR